MKGEHMLLVILNFHLLLRHTIDDLFLENGMYVLWYVSIIKNYVFFEYNAANNNIY